MNNLEEIWKTIKDFPDYMISNLGRVKRITKGRGTTIGKILKPSEDKDGYLHVGLSESVKQCTKKMHRLVLETFDPVENMENLQVNHKNGIKSNNIYPENIEWLTPLDNVKHAIENGLINNKGKNSSLFGNTLRKKLGKNSQKQEKNFLKLGN